MSNRAITWTIIHFGLALILYAGAIQGQKWAENILLFAIWLNLAIWLFCCGSEAERTKIRVMGRPVPRVAQVSYDIAFLLVLVGAGWFILAAVWTLSTIIENGILEGWDREEGSSLT